MASAKKQRTKIDAKKAARSFYREGKTLKQSLMDGGLTETQSKKSKAILTERAHLMKAFKAEHERQIKKLRELPAIVRNRNQNSCPVNKGLHRSSVYSGSRSGISRFRRASA